MKDTIKITDLIGLISFTPFLIPEYILTLYVKWIIFLIGIILFLIYKIYEINSLNKRNISESKNKHNHLIEKIATINKNRNALAREFEEKSKTIDDLKNINIKYGQIMQILLQSLSTTMFKKDVDEEYINKLIQLLLNYTKFMEELKNGKQ